MNNHFNRITTRQSLDDLIARSNDQPVVIFKHSLTCPISAGAYDEMTRVTGDVTLIEVQNARNLSRDVEGLFGIEHESPQVIVLRNGKPVWHVSHRSIKTDAVQQALAES